MTREQTKTILATMAAVYPPNLMPQVTELTINVWFQLLQDMDYSLASAAVAAWLTTSKYPPTIADIRERLVKTEMDTAEQAWGRLMAAVRRFGHTEEQQALNSLVGASRAIAERFGWRYWCQMPIDEESTYYAQFRNAYNAETKKETERRQIPAVIREKLGIGGSNEVALLVAHLPENQEEQSTNFQQPQDRDTVRDAVERLQAVFKGLRDADTERGKADA